MSLIPIKNELNNLKLKAYKEIDFSENPGYFGSVGGFFRSIATSLRFVLTEKENIVFALLQWGCIVLAYYIWVQVLSWIPEEIWEKAENGDSYNKYADLILWLWSLACVGLAAYPLGILTACMNASCILRFQNKESTFTDCFKIALKHSGTIWIFSWIDGWWTVERIIERLPKKNNRTPASVRAYNEIIYQIWKMLTLGFVPALLFGRSFKEACQDSLNLAKKRFLPLIKLRLGYSLICWIVGIGCYIGTILFFAFWFTHVRHDNKSTAIGKDLFQSRQGTANTGVVSDFTIFVQRYIEVYADDCLFAGKVKFVNCHHNLNIFV